MTIERTRDIQGVTVPTFFYGTAWKEDRTRELTEQALAAGFLAIDTANQRKHYFEAGVGEAVQAMIARGHVTREQLFLQTKFTHRAGQDHRLPYDPKAPMAEQVAQSFASSLEHLGVERIDSYVLHGPSLQRGLSTADWAVYKAMEELHEAGKARLLGVSNVSASQLEEVCGLSRVKPAFVQNRCYAERGWDAAVRKVAASFGVVYQGFSLLTANERVLRGSDAERIAQRHGVTLSQVVFRFAMQVGMIPLTGTTSPQHMAEDLAVYDFELSDDEVEAIQAIAG